VFNRNKFDKMLLMRAPIIWRSRILVVLPPAILLCAISFALGLAYPITLANFPTLEELQRLNTGIIVLLTLFVIWNGRWLRRYPTRLYNSKELITSFVCIFTAAVVVFSIPTFFIVALLPRLSNLIEPNILKSELKFHASNNFWSCVSRDGTYDIARVTDSLEKFGYVVRKEHPLTDCSNINVTCGEAAGPGDNEKLCLSANKTLEIQTSGDLISVSSVSEDLRKQLFTLQSAHQFSTSQQSHLVAFALPILLFNTLLASASSLAVILLPFALMGLQKVFNETLSGRTKHFEKVLRWLHLRRLEKYHLYFLTSFPLLWSTRSHTLMVVPILFITFVAMFFGFILAHISEWPLLYLKEFVVSSLGDDGSETLGIILTCLAGATTHVVLFRVDLLVKQCRNPTELIFSLLIPMLPFAVFCFVFCLFVLRGYWSSFEISAESEKLGAIVFLWTGIFVVGFILGGAFEMASIALTRRVAAIASIVFLCGYFGVLLILVSKYDIEDAAISAFFWLPALIYFIAVGLLLLSRNWLSRGYIEVVSVGLISILVPYVAGSVLILSRLYFLESFFLTLKSGATIASQMFLFLLVSFYTLSAYILSRRFLALFFEPKEN
jgi:hypothetical protein